MNLYKFPDVPLMPEYPDNWTPSYGARCRLYARQVEAYEWGFSMLTWWQKLRLTLGLEVLVPFEVVLDGDSPRVKLQREEV